MTDPVVAAATTGEHAASRDRFDCAREGGAGHGIAAPRGLASPPGARGARFTTMFPFLPRHDPGKEAICALTKRLHEVRQEAKENHDVPSGYTYFGQFIDHDITFDATSKIDRDNDPDALVNFRTPRLDLDSLYGSGPADQPFLYDWDCGALSGARLLVGRNPPDGCSALIDLPRNQQERALIGDSRNDEHLIISQLHLLFIKFHNRVVEELHRARPKLRANRLFDAAHQTVRWHYQWIVTHDFLRRILGPTSWNAMLPRLTGGARAPAPGSGAHDLPAVPVEFSAAAYRFGHSMVRFDYDIRGEKNSIHILPTADQHDGHHLGGFRRLPARFEIKWPQFFGRDAPVKSMRIDHRLTTLLHRLPPDGASLIQLNLDRGRALRLPSGCDVARAMGADALRGPQLFPLGSPQSPPFWPAGGDDAVQRAAILDAPPLWFYLLREAATYQDPLAAAPDGTPEDGGLHLGPVGGRIVAETLVGLLEADPASYLYQDPPWRPTLAHGVFNEMVDLVRFALADEPAALLP